MLVEERIRLVEVLLLDEPALTVVERRADGATDLVTDDVAEEGGDEERHDRHPEVDVHLAGRDEQAHGEQQRVARQDGEEQAALDEDDGERDPEEGVTVLLEQVRGVHPVRAQRDGRECGEGMHGLKGKVP